MACREITMTLVARYDGVMSGNELEEYVQEHCEAFSAFKSCAVEELTVRDLSQDEIATLERQEKEIYDTLKKQLKRQKNGVQRRRKPI